MQRNKRKNIDLEQLHASVGSHGTADNKRNLIPEESLSVFNMCSAFIRGCKRD